MFDGRPPILGRRTTVTKMSAALLCLSLVAGCSQEMSEDSRVKPYQSNSFFENDQSARPLIPNTVARGNLRTDTEFYTGKRAGAPGDTLDSSDTSNSGQGSAQATETIVPANEQGGATGQEGIGTDLTSTATSGEDGGATGEGGTGASTTATATSGEDGNTGTNADGGTDNGDSTNGGNGQDGTGGQNGGTGQQGGSGEGAAQMSRDLVTTMPFPVTEDVLARGQKRYNAFCAPCHAQTGYGDGMIVRRGLSAPPSLHDQRLVDAPIGHYYDVITNGYGRMYSYAARIRPVDRWAIAAYIRALQLSQKATIEDVPEQERQQLQGGGG